MTAYGLGFAYADDFHRLLLTLPTLRNFFTLKQARRVPFMLIPLRSYLGSVLALMVTFNFMWAILGVTMFEDVYPSIAEALDTSVVRVSSFQTVASSMLALMQVLIGEGWQDLMFAAMNGKHSWYWSLYFMVYVLVQTLLLTNLLVGVVLDSAGGFNLDEELSLQANVLYGDQLRELTELEDYMTRATAISDGDVMERRDTAVGFFPRNSIIRPSEVFNPRSRRSTVVPTDTGLVVEQPIKRPFQLLPHLTQRRLGVGSNVLRSSCSNAGDQRRLTLVKDDSAAHRPLHNGRV